MSDVKNIDVAWTKQIPGFVWNTSQDTYKKLISEGWRFYAVYANRGRCSWATSTITVPVWALKKSTAYAIWYVAHEMAHAVAGPKANHGPDFMAALIKLCPPECIWYETGYKPKHAVNAGILCTDF